MGAIWDGARGWITSEGSCGQAMGRRVSGGSSCRSRRVPRDRSPSLRCGKLPTEIAAAANGNALVWAHSAGSGMRRTNVRREAGRARNGAQQRSQIANGGSVAVWHGARSGGKAGPPDGGIVDCATLRQLPLGTFPPVPGASQSKRGSSSNTRASPICQLDRSSRRYAVS